MRMHTPARAEVNQHILAVVKESKDIKHDVVRFDIAVAYAAQRQKVSDIRQSSHLGVNAEKIYKAQRTAENARIREC